LPLLGARECRAEIDRYLGAEPSGVGPFASADSICEPIESERSGHDRPAAASLPQPKRDVHLAPRALDLERASRELDVSARFHGPAGECDARMLTDGEEFFFLQRRIDLGKAAVDRCGLEPNVNALDPALRDAEFAAETPESTAKG